MVTGSKPTLQRKFDSLLALCKAILNKKNVMKRNLIKVDLSGCKNWKECQKVIQMITEGRIKLEVSRVKI